MKYHSIITKYPKTGLYETDYTPNQRTNMFIKYVHNLYNDPNVKRKTTFYTNIINDFDTIINTSRNMNWLCNALSVPLPYNNNTLGRYDKMIYIKNLIDRFEKSTAIDKAGSSYIKYDAILSDRDISNKRKNLINESKLQTIKQTLEKTHDPLTVDLKMKIIRADIASKLKLIQSLEQSDTKLNRLIKVEEMLRSDPPYQHWSKLKQVWTDCGLDKIQTKINQHSKNTNESRKIKGSMFESRCRSVIHNLLAERYIQTVINITSNIVIKHLKQHIGEIDILAINNVTNEVLAIIEIKHNINDISHAHNQLQNIFNFIKQHELYQTSSNTEQLILTTVSDDPTDVMNTSMYDVYTILDMIHTDDVINQIANSGSCKQKDYKHIWTIMNQILKTNAHHGYDSPINMCRRYGDRLIILE